MSDARPHLGRPAGGSPVRDRRDAPAGASAGLAAHLGLIATKHLELRKRRGLMVAVAVLTLGLPVLVLGLRLVFHAVDPPATGRPAARASSPA